MSPAGVEILAQQGHRVYVEHGAGVGAGFSDQEYEKAGAHLAYSAEEVFGRSDLLLKVARPMKEELEWLQPGSVVAGLLHLASAHLPVLRPFSQIGGMMAAQTAARLLQNNWGGKGILIGGVPGVPPAEVVIIGAGVVGRNAARGFLGLGAHVTMIDININALQRVADHCPGVATMVSTKRNIERATAYADVVVGAVLKPGERAPVLVTREMVQAMKPRSVIIDVSIDEGGCVETSRPTTHDHPTYEEEGVLHYCVPNMPGVVARTATHAFVNAAVPFIVEMADKGIEQTLRDNAAIEAAVVTHAGKLHHMNRKTNRREADDGLD
jgi:alanine dehydrogenase